MSNRVTVDVDALYGKALGRLGDVGRYLDELRQLRAAKSNGNGRSCLSAPAPDEGPGPDDEDIDDEDEVTARCMPVED